MTSTNTRQPFKYRTPSPTPQHSYQNPDNHRSDTPSPPPKPQRKEPTPLLIKPPTPQRTTTHHTNYGTLNHRKAALEAVDEHWNPAWPADWQRHYTALRELVREESDPTVVTPGITVPGMDIGRWLARQRKPDIWQTLTDAQRQRMEQLGIAPLPPEPEPTTAPKMASGAFRRGIAALTQYKTREGHLTVPRGHVERLEDGTEVRLGVFLSNSKSRRAKLTTDKLAALAALGLEWASALLLSPALPLLPPLSRDGLLRDPVCSEVGTALARRSRDLDDRTALGPQQRGVADRVGGQRT
ncbi:helicase associated domain-containing protein [Streptomyces sp. NPDC046832]|uniref:helicase associated domain-containing protein n=1 Tax=Streptomyces sp. NPDC046832 TaxID=3155020 RepID=UPI0033C04406